MDTSTYLPITFWSSGKSRSRIVIVSSYIYPLLPVMIPGTRWIATNHESANEMRDLALRADWRNVGPSIPGQVSGYTWQKLRQDELPLNPSTGYLPGNETKFFDFGQGNNRVTLFFYPDSVFSPTRIGNTSLISLSPQALHHLQALFHRLPGNTAAARSQLADIFNQRPFSGSTINAIRQALLVPQPL